MPTSGVTSEGAIDGEAETWPAVQDYARADGAIRPCDTPGYAVHRRLPLCRNIPTNLEPLAEPWRHGRRALCTFLSAVKTAETEGMLACLESIERAHRNKDWKAAAWLLERRYGWWPNHMVTTVTEEQSSMDLSTDEGRSEVIAALQALPAELLAEAIAGIGADA